LASGALPAERACLERPGTAASRPAYRHVDHEGAHQKQDHASGQQPDTKGEDSCFDSGLEHDVEVDVLRRVSVHQYNGVAAGLRLPVKGLPACTMRFGSPELLCHRVCRWRGAWLVLVMRFKGKPLRAGEKLKSMLAIWAEATKEEKAKMLAIMLDTVYCDLNKKKIAALKPKSPFLPVFSLCDGLKEKEGLIFMPELVGIGNPEGSLVHQQRAWVGSHSSDDQVNGTLAGHDSAIQIGTCPVGVSACLLPFLPGHLLVRG